MLMIEGALYNLLSLSSYCTDYLSSSIYIYILLAQRSLITYDLFFYDNNN